MQGVAGNQDIFNGHRGVRNAGKALRLEADQACRRSDARKANHLCDLKPVGRQIVCPFGGRTQTLPGRFKEGSLMH
jgi:hypothetical protein